MRALDIIMEGPCSVKGGGGESEVPDRTGNNVTGSDGLVSHRRFRNLGDILERLRRRCVTFQLISGAQVTGFVVAVEDGVVEISVAGQPQFVVINKIELFIPTRGAAC